MNVFELIRQHAESRPDRAALVSGDTTLSYAQLAAVALRWGATLSAAGLHPGDRLGIALKDTPDFVLAMLGAAGHGIVVVPVDWRAPDAEKDRLVKHFEMAAILTEPGHTANVTGAIGVDEDWHQRVAETREPVAQLADGNADFAIKLSSGTTGLPKGAIVTHRQLIERLGRNHLLFGPLDGHRYLSVLPLCFSGGNNYCLFHLMSGSTVILYPPLFSPREYVDTVVRNEITFAFAVPTVLRWLLQLSEQDAPLLPSVQILISGTSPISAEEKRQVGRQICPNFYETYGSSASGQIAGLRPAELDHHAESVGRPNLMLEVQVVDENDGALPVGETGRVRCRGPGIARGYFGDPDQAGWSERLQDGWCYPGDLGWLDAAGYLHVAGRADDLIIRGGVNIHPIVVEAEMMRCPGVAEVAVVGRPAAQLGEEVVAFAVAGDGFDMNDLLSHCRRELAPHMLPVEVILLDSLPRTTSGKVRKRDLLVAEPPEVRR